MQKTCFVSLNKAYIYTEVDVNKETFANNELIEKIFSIE
jgi:hypothetical protein